MFRIGWRWTETRYRLQSRKELHVYRWCFSIRNLQLGHLLCLRMSLPLPILRRNRWGLRGNAFALNCEEVRRCPWPSAWRDMVTWWRKELLLVVWWLEHAFGIFRIFVRISHNLRSSLASSICGVWFSLQVTFHRNGFRRIQNGLLPWLFSPFLFPNTSWVVWKISICKFPRRQLHNAWPGFVFCRLPIFREVIFRRWCRLESFPAMAYHRCSRIVPIFLLAVLRPPLHRRLDPWWGWQWLVVRYSGVQWIRPESLS